MSGAGGAAGAGGAISGGDEPEAWVRGFEFPRCNLREAAPLIFYYGYNATGGPVGVGQATAKSMVLNLVLVNFIGMLGTQIFWGTDVRAPIGG